MSLRQSNYELYRDTQGESTNPTTSTVLADTGVIGNGTASANAPLSGAGLYEVLIVASATATFECAVQQRNAANGATVGDVQIFYVPANTTVAVPMRFQLEAGQRIRCLPNANLTGDAVVNVFAQRVG